MNKAEFITALQEALRPLGEQERADALGYYDEWIEERMQDRGCGEEEAVSALESPAAIAAAILDGREKESSARPAQADEKDGFRAFKTRGDDVRRILIRTKDSRMLISPSASDELVLRYNEDEYHSYDCILEDGTLRLELRPRTRFFFGINLFFSRQYRVELSLPADFWGTLDAQSSNSAIDMERVSPRGDLTLKTSNAHIGVKELAARSIHLKTSNASLRLEQLKAEGAMELHTSNGHIEARALSSGGGMVLESSNARIEARQLDSRTSIRLESSNGSLHVTGLFAPRLSLKTSNASIKGSLPGPASDYSVQSATRNGKNSLKDHPFSGEKSLEACTSNANIKLEFER